MRLEKKTEGGATLNTPFAVRIEQLLDTEKEILDRVWEYYVEGGNPCGQSGAACCFYEVGADGVAYKCAVGCLFPDEYWEQLNMDGCDMNGDVSELSRWLNEEEDNGNPQPLEEWNEVTRGVSEDFLAALQACHDRAATVKPGSPIKPTPSAFLADFKYNLRFMFSYKGPAS